MSLYRFGFDEIEITVEADDKISAKAAAKAYWRTEFRKLAGAEPAKLTELISTPVIRFVDVRGESK